MDQFFLEKSKYPPSIPSILKVEKELDVSSFILKRNINKKHTL